MVQVGVLFYILVISYQINVFCRSTDPLGCVQNELEQAGVTSRSEEREEFYSVNSG